MTFEKYNIEPSIYDAESNIKLFLSKLKDKIHKYKNLSQILVITHGRIIQIIQNIIINVNVNSEKNIYLAEKPFSSLDEVRGNCTCLYIGF